METPDPQPTNPDTHGQTSSRERGLWVATGLVTAAIFAGLLLSGGLARQLLAAGVPDMLFSAGFALVILAIAWSGWRQRPGPCSVAVGLSMAAVALLTVARVTTAAERTHLVEYGALALLLHAALLERSVRTGHSGAAVGAVLLTVTVSAVDEGLQSVLPNRVFDPIDLLFNALAAIGAVSGSAALRWARRADRTG